MRILLALALLAAAACGGSKKSAASPPAPTEGEPSPESDMTNEARPDNPDDARDESANPCDGGE